MSTPYRVVRLLKNRLYPTYQLHCLMANKKTDPWAGLRLAGLITMDWLRQRLGDEAPEALRNLPDPERGWQAAREPLPSLHLSAGFLIDIVSDPERGLWTLQITEPDLGSDPGNPEQSRPPVPGRVIETNVGYRVVGGQLECGFQTVISDPEGTEQKAEVYRLAIVRRLAEHPDFGLKQVTRLSPERSEIKTVEQLKNLISVWKDSGNQLPCVLFTYARKEEDDPLAELVSGQAGLLPGVTNALPMDKIPIRKQIRAELPYDTDDFVKYGVTFFRAYQLDDGLLERFQALSGAAAGPGDIVVLEPPCFGGRVRVLPYKPSKARQTQTMEQLRAELYSYPREKAVSFGNIRFLSAAREGMLRESADAVEQSHETAARWAEKLAEQEARWKDKLQAQQQETQALAGQLERQRQYQERLEREKDQLRRDHEKERERFARLLAERDEDIAYLKRKLDQPEEHHQIAAWVARYFPDRLILHSKARALLEEKAARSVSVELICDALDFLATDYWERRYARISTEEMNSRCSEKYGRPFEVKPTGSTTIEYTPSQYKIKYFPGAAGKPVESPLDYHLGVGCDPGNLLRIYFLHDDEKKLIVVGSLPRHLKAVTIK